MNLADTIMEQLTAHHASRAELSRALWAMSAAEREAAMRRGALTSTQLLEWARRRPDEVPTVNGEWEFLAAGIPENVDVEDPDE